MTIALRKFSPLFFSCLHIISTIYALFLTTFTTVSAHQSTRCVSQPVFHYQFPFSKHFLHYTISPQGSSLFPRQHPQYFDSFLSPTSFNLDFDFKKLSVIHSYTRTIAGTTEWQQNFQNPPKQSKFSFQIHTSSSPISTTSVLFSKKNHRRLKEMNQTWIEISSSFVSLPSCVIIWEFNLLSNTFSSFF